MPLMTVQMPEGTLSQAQKDALAEDLTQVILQIEGGADTPAGRSIAWVRFQELPRQDWYLGGRSDESFEAAAGRWLIELNVPEGSMDQTRKSGCHTAITDAVLKISGKTGVEGAARSIWIQIFEWPEGHLATSGRTASLLGIAKVAGIPAEHPLLSFPRAYFEAKDRLYDQAAFPAGTAGRALVRY
ncbi:MAG: tautomerase family protein [Rhodocyclaceae bacterium]|jgi:phenylpyruvate tautomerase PptA (4-oxalocrotonate tautomerase family)|nr:tautomerase family protein [Rhodocyclaceae bacterium]MCA3160314.1 tautomerase family protein [Burkholderiales bacterium]MCA3592703.1 tautomerase family protein [Methylocystis sp.]MCA3653705.1 tautomerase family protein [Methylobacterium sp.]